MEALNRNLVWIIVSLFLSVMFSSIISNKTYAMDLKRKCKRIGTIIKTTNVFNNVPRLSTTRGIVGTRIAILSPSSKVLICEERKVNIGIYSLTFYKIVFRARGSIGFGWIKSGTFIFSSNESKIVPVAFSLSELPETNDKKILDGKEIILDLPEASSIFYGTYTILLLAVLFGMVGKTVFMYAENRFTSKELIVRFALTFFFAPMAFGSVLQLDIEIGNQKDLFQYICNAITTGFTFSSITSFKASDNGKK